MKKRRKIFAAIALLAGLGLVYFELAHRRRAGTGEFGFWLVIGVLLTFFALLDLLSKPGDRP